MAIWRLCRSFVVFFSYVETLVAIYGNKYTENMANLTHQLDPVIMFKVLKNIFMKLKIWVDGSQEIFHIFFFTSYFKNSGCYGNKYNEFQDF
jgi:hypothetical protein